MKIKELIKFILQILWVGSTVFVIVLGLIIMGVGIIIKALTLL